MTQNPSPDFASIAAFRLRLATASDRKRVIPLINEAFAVERFFDGDRTDEADLAALMEKGEILLAEDGAGKIAASIYVEARGELGYLGMLAVAPTRQRRGIGAWIVAQAEEHLRRLGCEAAELTVLSLRSELPPIYRRLGYREAGTREFKSSRPFKPGVACHSIVMLKKL